MTRQPRTPHESEVHVWSIKIDQHSGRLDALTRTLSRGELARAQRFVVETRCQKFIVAHGVLREILASYLGVAPERLIFTVAKTGKPALASSPAENGLNFNMSHSGNWLIVGVTRSVPVGVDVERLRPVADAIAVADRYFPREERDALMRLEGESRNHAFLSCWTRKEAVTKAHGAGMGLDLSEIATGVAPITDGGIAVQAAGQEYVVQDIDALGDHVGAVACRATQMSVVRKSLL